MEDKILASGPLGAVGSYELAWKSGSLMLTLGVKVGPLKMDSSVGIDSAEALDEIAKAIPGTIDDAIIGVAKAALLKK
jgi:hypothetical protein